MSRRARSKRERISDTVVGPAPWDALSAALAGETTGGSAVAAPPSPATRDGRASAATGGVVLDGEVVLADYDAGWPDRFDREAARIREVLGPRALQVEHVGSTAVPGLAARPVIDVLLVVPDSANEPAYASDLEREGYVLREREPEAAEHRLFSGPDGATSVHVYSTGAAPIEQMLQLRDWLRERPEERDRFDRRKRDLAGRPWRQAGLYADAKRGVIESIVARAEASHGTPAA
ncbi:MAG TPA: GrpB family protein [Candidatus Limnocylindrales bacterium]|nr:GrpB family protein [Candidatus Limnocylindrales bacterium]